MAPKKPVVAKEDDLSHLSGPGEEMNKDTFGPAVVRVFKDISKMHLEADDQDKNPLRSPAEEKTFLDEMKEKCKDVPDLEGWPREELQAACMRGMKYRMDRACECCANFVAWRLELQKNGGKISLDNPIIKKQLDVEKFKITGKVDLFGRSILLVQLPKHNAKEYSSLDMIMCFAYIIEKMIRDKSETGLATQLNGVCVVHNLQGLQFSNMDPRVPREIFQAFFKKIPLRLGAVLMCQPPVFIRIMFNVISVFLSKKIRQRIHLIFNIKQLKAYIKPENIPAEIKAILPADSVPTITDEELMRDSDQLIRDELLKDQANKEAK